MIVRVWAFSGLFHFIISVVAVIVAIKSRKKFSELSHLFIYPLTSLIQENFSMIFFLIPTLKVGNDLQELFFGISVHFFLLVEFVCIYFFYYKLQLFPVWGKKILKYSFFSFFLIYFLMAIFSNNYLLSFRSYYFMQSSFILLPSFIYIYHLFTDAPKLDLANEPSFWFNGGIFIFFTLTLPIFFMIKYFDEDEPHTSTYATRLVYNLGYIIIFLFQIKSYLCKPKTMI